MPSVTESSLVFGLLVLTKRNFLAGRLSTARPRIMTEPLEGSPVEAEVSRRASADCRTSRPVMMTVQHYAQPPTRGVGIQLPIPISRSPTEFPRRAWNPDSQPGTDLSNRASQLNLVVPIRVRSAHFIFYFCRYISAKWRIALQSIALSQRL